VESPSPTKTRGVGRPWGSALKSMFYPKSTPAHALLLTLRKNSRRALEPNPIYPRPLVNKSLYHADARHQGNSPPIVRAGGGILIGQAVVRIMDPNSVPLPSHSNSMPAVLTSLMLSSVRHRRSDYPKHCPPSRPLWRSYTKCRSSLSSKPSRGVLGVGINLTLLVPC
jgi:hypothetical protein